MAEGFSKRSRRETTVPKRKKSTAKTLHDLEFAAAREASAERKEREAKRTAAKLKQIRKNRKNEWTVVWQGGAPQ